jgi:O-acetylhomoserine (thiol)-lyase
MQIYGNQHTPEARRVTDDHGQRRNFETLAIHEGHEPDSTTLSRGVPIYRTASYVFRDSAHAADLFSLRRLGNIYTRLSNPTTDVLERRIAALEGGAGALATASGTSAIFYSLVNCMEVGDEFIATRDLYGGTYTMFNDILPRFGIEPRFVENGDPGLIRGALTSKTRAVFVEAIGNPDLHVPDFDEIGRIAEDAHVPFIVDATFTTPYLFRPLEHGAHVSVHSLTKWIGGHGTAIGGVVTDSGKFDWSDPKFRLFNEPDSSYFGLRFGRDLGDLGNLAYILRMRLVPLRNLGACLSPDNSWIFLQGLETLPLRMERHFTNAMEIALWLQRHDRVAWVSYPGLPSHPSHETATRYFAGRGYGGTLVFGVRGGAVAAARFIDSLKLFSHLANVGDAKSLAIHPAGTTHSQLDGDERAAAGVPPDLIRLSIGLENVDDIKEDLDQALRKE